MEQGTCPLIFSVHGQMPSVGRILLFFVLFTPDKSSIHINHIPAYPTPFRRRPRVRLEAVMSGGGQERGLRSGTVPTHLVVGLGAACKVAKEVSTEDSSVESVEPCT